MSVTEVDDVGPTALALVPEADRRADARAAAEEFGRRVKHIDRLRWAFRRGWYQQLDIQGGTVPPTHVIPDMEQAAHIVASALPPMDREPYFVNPELDPRRRHAR